MQTPPIDTGTTTTSGAAAQAAIDADLLLARLIDARFDIAPLAAELNLSLSQLGSLMTEAPIARAIEGLQRLSDARLHFELDRFRRSAVYQLVSAAAKTEDFDEIRRTCMDVLTASAAAGGRRSVDGARALSLLDNASEDASHQPSLQVSEEQIRKAFELHDAQHEQDFDFQPDANVSTASPAAAGSSSPTSSSSSSSSTSRDVDG